MSIFPALRQRIPLDLSLLKRRRPTLAAMIWRHFLSQPGFRDQTRQALLDLEEGRAIPLREIPRER